MKVAPEKKNRTYLAIGLMVVALFTVWYFDFSGPDYPTTPAPVATGATPGVVTASSTAANRPTVSLDPTLHLAELEQLRSIEYSGSGRDLFHFGAAPAKVATIGPGGRGVAKPGTPSGLIAPPPAVHTGPAPTPPPPAIPMKFFGYANPMQGPSKVFLQMGDESFVVAEGDTVAHRYLIEKIGKLSVRVKDTQTQSEQELPLQQG